MSSYVALKLTDRNRHFVLSGIMSSCDTESNGIDDNAHEVDCDRERVQWSKGHPMELVTVVLMQIKLPCV